jgi:hypothetical protein
MSFGLLISLLINTIYKLYALMSSMLSCHSSLSFASFVWKICYLETKTATHFIQPQPNLVLIPRQMSFQIHLNTAHTHTHKPLSYKPSNLFMLDSNLLNPIHLAPPFEQFYEHKIQQSDQMMFTELYKFLPQNSPSREI